MNPFSVHAKDFANEVQRGPELRITKKSISFNRKRDRNAKSHHQSFSFIDSKGPKIFTPVRKSKKQFASFEFQRKTVGGHFRGSVGLQNSEADSTKFAKFVGCAVAE